MADADFTRLLIHSCDIWVKTEGAVDARNAPTFVWGAETEGVACRLEVTRRVEVEIITHQAVVIQDYNLMLPAGTTITEDRRVVIGGSTYSVNAVRSADDDTGVHHIEAVLDLIKPD